MRGAVIHGYRVFPGENKAFRYDFTGHTGMIDVCTFDGITDMEHQNVLALNSLNTIGDGSFHAPGAAPYKIAFFIAERF